jgi:hypothetical protein
MCARFGKSTIGDLVKAFKQFQDSNNLEIITCGATHGYLPLMKMYPQAVWAQLQVACESYAENFDRPPNGIWLPECAYYEGVERMLADAGLRYFLTDGHGILYARPRPRYGSYAPIYTETGVAAFGRDHESSQQVWSSQVGYPGAAEYREFYRDLGWDAEYEYIKPYVMPNGQRKNVGIKYHKITGKGLGLSDKDWYDPYWAQGKGCGTCQQLHVQPGAPGGASERHDASPPNYCLPLRCRAVRPLVVRRPLVLRLPVPQKLVRPGHLRNDPFGRLPAGATPPNRWRSPPNPVGGSKASMNIG